MPYRFPFVLIMIAVLATVVQARASVIVEPLDVTGLVVAGASDDKRSENEQDKLGIVSVDDNGTMGTPLSASSVDGGHFPPLQSVCVIFFKPLQPEAQVVIELLLNVPVGPIDGLFRPPRKAALF